MRTWRFSAVSGVPKSTARPIAHNPKRYGAGTKTDASQNAAASAKPML